MTPEYRVALFRALLSGLFLGLQAGLVAYSATHQVEAAVLTTASTFVGTVIVRAGLEGTFDSSRGTALRERARHAAVARQEKAKKAAATRRSKAKKKDAS